MIFDALCYLHEVCCASDVRAIEIVEESGIVSYDDHILSNVCHVCVRLIVEETGIMSVHDDIM